MNTKWGIYPWFAEHCIELIHPDDFKSFECIEEEDFITLRYNNNCYRVRNKLFKPVPAPKYYFGEIVKIKNNEKEAIITDIM